MSDQQGKTVVQHTPGLYTEYDVPDFVFDLLVEARKFFAMTPPHHTTNEMLGRWIALRRLTQALEFIDIVKEDTNEGEKKESD